ncbi:reverse transcriptase domain-containing protein [Tanacetum coccineum]
MDSNFNNESDPWEFGLDIDDFDLNLTPVLRSSSSTRVEPYPLTPNPVRIIPDHADGALMSTQQYMQQIIEDVGEDDDFNSGAWVSATNYMKAFGGNVTGCLGDIDNFLKKGKLDQVVAIVKSCFPNVLGAAMILSNVSVFTPKPLQHYLNITMKNVVEVFCKDAILLGSGSG